MKKAKIQLINWRKMAIIILIGIFTLVPIVHVAVFTGSFEPAGFEWLGYVYALGLDSGIAVCAWFTRWDTTRREAWICYSILVLADGSLNVAYLKPWQRGNSFAWVYAILPTLIVALLSLLARKVDALSAKYRKIGVGGAVVSAIGSRLGVIESHQETIERRKRANIHRWRAIRARLDGSGDDLSAGDVQRLLEEHGYEPVPPSTARRWAND